MVLFPTEQWLAAYGRRLHRNDVLDEVAAGWGVEFDGDVRLVIEEVPLSETALGDLPDEVLADLPETVRDGVEDVSLADAPDRFGDAIRPTLPDRVRDLIRQIEENVVDGDIHAQFGLREGNVTYTEVLSAPEEREAGIVIRGTLTTWQQILDGRPTLSALVTDDLAVEARPDRLVRYSTMLQLLGEVAARVETTHLFAVHRQPSRNFVVDAAAGSSALLQQSAERQARRTLQGLSLF